ncbi:hypothetical protein GCM10009546_12130 [Actinomadura livida]|uniref:Lipocalin-like domain-containing protein n=2 Tax=Actinomadura livida TaxID=79909 RepID=A0ABP3NVF8_9ACTN|nr:hypothetical protein [Actinomadura catellatispora]GGT98814.1 hypothetical protein GCM10010208_22960 [Actinomadura livida]
MRSSQPDTVRRNGRARITAASAAIAAMALFGSGCAIPNFTTESRPTRELPPPPELSTPDLSTPELRQSTLTGSWRGTYTCPQGLMQLNLTLVQRSSGTVSGIFRFAPAPGNSDGLSGSFTLRGHVTGSSLALHGDSWLSRPGAYEMVSLSARLSSADPDQIHGTIQSPGCGTFTVQRR